MTGSHDYPVTMVTAQTDRVMSRVFVFRETQEMMEVEESKDMPETR